MLTEYQCNETYSRTKRFNFKHGADPSKKNRDGAAPIDLVREDDQEVADLLRGNAALLDAAKKGNLTRVQRLVTSENINCRDAQGRNSTPLHLAGTDKLHIIINQQRRRERGFFFKFVSILGCIFF